MFHRLFVVAALLSSYTGGSLAHGQPERVLAFAGGDVILPCSFNISDNSEFPTVEWSKEGLKPNVVFLYRDGCETYEMKDPAFEYRTSLIMKELKDGNISLRISNVQVSDAGKYQCLTFLKKAGRKVTTRKVTVELVVAAVSEPKLSLISAEGGGLAVLCEAGCWLPEPRITFLDDKGKIISAEVEKSKREQDPRGCFTVTQRDTLPRATSSVTCRVHQPELNQTRETKILIPALCVQPDVGAIAVAVGGTALFFLAAAGLIALLCKKCGQLAAVKQPQSMSSSDQSIMCELLQGRVNGTDNRVNGDRRQLRRESEFHVEDETLCELLKHKVTRLSRPAISRSHSTSTPAPARPSQRKHRICSSPDIFHIYSAPSNSSLADSSLLRIDFAASPHPRTLPRRHSSVLPQLADFNKRYSLLGNLTEDDELIRTDSYY